MQLRQSPVPAAQTADDRTRLPLPLVPARDRVGVRRKCRSRGRLCCSRGHRAHARADPFRERARPDDCTLPHLPDGGVEQLRGGGRANSLCARWNTGPARSSTPRHPHLHGVQATLGGVAGGCPRGATVLCAETDMVAAGSGEVAEGQGLGLRRRDVVGRGRSHALFWIDGASRNVFQLSALCLAPAAKRSSCSRSSGVNASPKSSASKMGRISTSLSS